MWEFSGSAEDFCAGFDIQMLLFTASGPVKLSFLLVSFRSCLRVFRSLSSSSFNRPIMPSDGSEEARLGRCWGEGREGRD